MGRRRGPGPGRGLHRAGIALPLLALTACAVPVPGTINLYDLSGSNLMRCDSVTRDPGRSRGVLQCSATGGEKFQGEWVTMARTAEKAAGTWASLPSTPADALAARWSWGAGYGVDMESLAGTYGMFLLYGSKGTVIDGVFIFRGDRRGIMGIATDNKGHRYKVMG
ncbi:hypothetical protein [Mesoterricola silvestris]|uniref:Lipoprotein n=1 Tax=Mesoterricola silvestris TaxID=2927979 RepID=A0AA48KDS0_9BACT|nr:hypothetical protein [Mesoterricola silvestris]BDU74723.1 hypothetical protein METEAL_38970 [Mesoterricola silvestris]